MYEDDRFVPKYDDEENYLDLKNSMLHDVKALDKGYRKIQININRVWTDGKYYKSKQIEIYVSGDIGKKIRNAITGFKYDDKVGSKQEDLYFKVKNNSAPLGSTAGSLFYESPEQFEKHQFIELSREVKEKWYAKNIAARIKNKMS